jgi:hypothetical protein
VNEHVQTLLSIMLYTSTTVRSHIAMSYLSDGNPSVRSKGAYKTHVSLHEAEKDINK